MGQLIRPRSDSDGVSAGPVGYLVGGYDGVTSRTVFQFDPGHVPGQRRGPAAGPAESLKTADPDERGSMSKTPHATPQRGY
jgi:hypothetical protein